MPSLLALLFGCAPSPDDSATAVEVSRNPCGPWAAIETDRTWSYATTEEATVPGEWTTEVRHFRDGSGTLETASSTGAGGDTEDATTRTSFTCASGFAVTGVERQWAGLSGGVAYNGATTTAYGEPVLVWPQSLAAGDTWTAHYTGVTYEDEAHTAVDFTETYVANAPVDVAVPAGEFKAYRVTITTVNGNTETTRNEWVSSGTGIVAGNGYELIWVR